MEADLRVSIQNKISVDNGIYEINEDIINLKESIRSIKSKIKNNI